MLLLISSTPPEPSGRLLRARQPNDWHEGVILARERDPVQPTRRLYTILYTEFQDDGPVPNHTEQQIRSARATTGIKNHNASKSAFAIGAKVLAEYEPGEWYAGVVESKQSDGTYTVFYQEYEDSVAGHEQVRNKLAVLVQG